jgi:hypothetical protein
MAKVEVIQHVQVMFSVHIITRRLSTNAQIKGHNSIVAGGGGGGAVD